jgi:hypothetical protein
MRTFSAFLSLVLAFVAGTGFRSAAQTGVLREISAAKPIKSNPVQPINLTHISPGSGVVGASVTIMGSNFGSAQGSSTVTFNGTAASVVNWTDWSIVAKVPSGDSSGKVVVTVGALASNGVNFSVVTLPTNSIVLSNFGFQCGLSPTDCGGPGGTIVWPQMQSQPEFLRLHDAGTSWSDLSTGSGTYDWTTLEKWLDVIAKHQPLDVIEVFSWVPCWDAPNCEQPIVAPTGTDAPPNDLTASGSPSFNEFVTQFVQHCSPAGNCAGNCPPGRTCTTTNLIRYYEMWNEWNTPVRWTGNVNQLYEMVAPAVPIIRANVKNSVILTPSTTSGSITDFQAWLNLETTKGPISNWVVWHDYLSGNTPEEEWSLHSAIYLSNQVSLPAWKNIPWADTETNFNTQTYSCPATFSADDCTGQIVRWQLLHASNGAMNLNWYKWPQTLEENSQYGTVYHYMTQYLLGGKFRGPCTFTAAEAATTWTCNFTESGGAIAALWVWTPNEAGARFTVPSGYVDYLDLTGAKTTVSDGQSINIGPIPIMLEQ